MYTHNLKPGDTFKSYGSIYKVVNGDLEGIFSLKDENGDYVGNRSFRNTTLENMAYLLRHQQIEIIRRKEILTII